MARPKLQLPTIQNWNCQSCSGCCRQHGIVITDEERQRIENQGWTAEDGIPLDQPLYVRMGGWLTKPWYRLAHRPDGSCVFLNDEGLCRIHAKFGEPAKPLACRIYPYAFHPAGRQLAVSLRFSCPTVVANQGAPVAQQQKEIEKLAGLVVPSSARDIPAPAINRRSQLDWPDFRRFVSALEAEMSDESVLLRTRLLRAVTWVSLVDDSTFDKLQGGRIDEFLGLIREATAAEIDDETEFPTPSKLGLTQFRLLAGHYARKDTWVSSMSGLAGRLRLLRTAWQLARGRGRLPGIRAELIDTTFERLDSQFVPPESADELFARFFAVKVQGLHFCGRAFYRVPFSEGFLSLAAVYPVVHWLSRWIAVSDGRDEVRESDVGEALAMADHHHGYSPALGRSTFRRRIRILSRQDELRRLITHYG